MNCRLVALIVLFSLNACIDSTPGRGAYHNKYTHLANIHTALFIYYMDNNKFPSDKEGLVYGLVKTGKNAPYYFFNFGKYGSAEICRKNGEELVSSISEIKPGDKFYTLTKERTEITYSRIKSGKEFKIMGMDLAKEKNSGTHPLLKFNNLPYLRYKEINKFRSVAQYFENIDYISIEFYLKSKK